jgi:hypothetical protein
MVETTMAEMVCGRNVLWPNGVLPKRLESRSTGEIVVFLQTGCFLYPSKLKHHSLYLLSMDEETECRSLYFSMDY